MQEEDNYLKSTEHFREKMAERQDYMGMHLPRIFANKADDLFGNLLFPARQKADEGDEKSE
jgi:hypothetical protein